MAAHRRLPIKDSDATCDQAANPHSICMWNPDMYGLRCETPQARAYYDSIFRLYAEWGVDFVKCDDIAREYPHCEKEIEVISAACRECGRGIFTSSLIVVGPFKRFVVRLLAGGQDGDFVERCVLVDDHPVLAQEFEEREEGDDDHALR